MMSAILTTYQGAFLGPIARVLGKILEAIYYVLSLVGIENTGICIVLFTFLVNALMLPLQIKQQKFAKMSNIMNPEIMAIQNKYKNKKDQASQQKMSMETQAVYQKYGVSPASGCLPLLITFPILFALYRVIYNIPAYVNQVYDIYAGVAGNLKDLDITVAQLADFMKTKTYVVTNAVNDAAKTAAKTDIKYYIDVIGQFNQEAWDKLKNMDVIQNAKDAKQVLKEITSTSTRAASINSFFGMNIADAPKVPFVGGNALTLGFSIPVFSVITQIISTKLSMAGTPQQNMQDNPTANSMKTMNTVMPFVTGVMCFMFPIGVGLYWVAGNVFRIFQQLFINLYFSKVDMEEMLAKNAEKARERMIKRGIDPDKVQNYAKTKTSTINKNTGSQPKKNTANVNKAVNKAKKSDYKRPDNSKYKEGSIAAYANMLNRDKSQDTKKN